MMQLIVKNRSNGKTTDLIHMSAAKQLPIVCYRPEFIERQAKELGYLVLNRETYEKYRKEDIYRAKDNGKALPEPISYADYIRTPGKAHGNHKVLIDELDWFLRATYGIECECATVDMGWPELKGRAG